MPRVERKAPFICITLITKAFALLMVLIVHSAVVPIMLSHTCGIGAGSNLMSMDNFVVAAFQIG